MPRSFIINHLEQVFGSQDVGIAYIYCNHNDRDQTPVSLLASLLRQFMERRLTMMKDIRDMHNSHSSKQTRPSLAEYSSMLQKVVRGFSKVFVVIDALDEYIEQNGTREVLIREIQALQPDVHLLVTSRWVPNIQQEFGSLQLEIRASDDDIKHYLAARIFKAARLRRHVNEDKELQEKIVDTIGERCQGMYV